MSVVDSILGPTVEKLLDAALDLVPADQVRPLLDAAAIRRANREADLAELIKFGKTSGG